MQLIRSFSDYRKQDRDLVLAIGNFDGMHRGHAAVIKRTVDLAHISKLEAAVMTFTPHPRQFFRPDEIMYTLSTFRDKFESLKSCGVDKLFNLRFDATFASMDARTFVRDLLIGRLGVKKVIVGSLFYFARGGRADFSVLKSLCEQYGAEAYAQDGILIEGQRVSSSAVRESLLRGDLAAAALMLDRPYSITGRVCHGNALGRTMGFPTANVHFFDMQPPLNGVYAVRVHTVYGDYDGMCNAGMRPSIRENDKRFLLEAHLFNFSGDLYATPIRISFISKIRDETVFSNLNELKERLSLDRLSAQFSLSSFKKRGL